MQLIGYNMLDVSGLCALQLSSRQRYIAQTGPFYVVFLLFIAQPIKLQRFVKFCYAVFHAYLTTYLLLFYASFQRLISNGWCNKPLYYVQRMTEHYFPLKIPIISNTTMSFSPENQPRGTDGPVPAT